MSVVIEYRIQVNGETVAPENYSLYTDRKRHFKKLLEKADEAEVNYEVYGRREAMEHAAEYQLDHPFAEVKLIRRQVTVDIMDMSYLLAGPVEVRIADRTYPLTENGKSVFYKGAARQIFHSRGEHFILMPEAGKTTKIYIR